MNVVGNPYSIFFCWNVFYFLTDIQNFCCTIYNKLSAKFCNENTLLKIIFVHIPSVVLNDFPLVKVLI